MPNPGLETRYRDRTRKPWEGIRCGWQAGPDGEYLLKCFHAGIKARLKEQDAGTSLVFVKMWAESDMCFNLLAGSLLVEIVMLVVLATSESCKDWIQLQRIALPILVFICLTADFRHRGVVRRGIQDFRLLRPR